MVRKNQEKVKGSSAGFHSGFHSSQDGKQLEKTSGFPQLYLIFDKGISKFRPKTRTMASTAIEPLVRTPLLFLRCRDLLNDSLAVSPDLH